MLAEGLLAGGMIFPSFAWQGRAANLLGWLILRKRRLGILDHLEQIGHRSRIDVGSQFAQAPPIRSEKRVDLRAGCDVMGEIMTFFRKGR